MTRTLATIQKVSEVINHPNADRLDLAKIKGWTVVTGRDEVKPGDWVIYFEIDSFLPEIPEFEFLRNSSFRTHPELGSGFKLKTQKLRGVISQGLLIPFTKIEHLLPDSLPGLEENLDVTEFLNIKKWEPVIPTQLQGFVKGNFPSFLRKSDQERIENCSGTVFTDYQETLFEVTLKLDGSSCTTYFKDGEVGVCSRNLELKLAEENETNAFVKTATETGLLAALKGLHRNIAVAAELMGPGIQGNREKLNKLDLFVFDIWDIDAQAYLGSQERFRVVSQLTKHGFSGAHVPLIDTGKTLLELGISDVPSSKVYVDRPSLNSSIAEGCVFKSIDGQFSFKSINNKYLLKFTD